MSNTISCQQQQFDITYFCSYILSCSTVNKTTEMGKSRKSFN